MIFGKGRPKQNLNFVLSNSHIEIVDHFKYLGIIFARDWSFAKTLKNNTEQAIKAMAVLRRKFKSLNLTIDLQIDLFNKMIMPVLLYGYEMWGYCNTKQIERVQLQFLKSIFNLKQSTPNVTCMVYGDFGVYPLEVDIITRMISYWTRLIAPDTMKFSNLFYKFLFYSTSEKKSAWLEYIKRIVENCGFSGIWAAQRVENTRWFFQSIKQKIKDLYVTEWFFTVTNSSSCMNYLYRLYKENIALERYLLKVPYELKRNLCLFRTRNHRLAVETGQWSNTDINE